ncbi:16S rRNA (guanine(966)-N(2))-methyltransferase RsmD [Kibdelosporangium philippinense]|uniref:16S rRNA (Guanine(966)-N(2))-methyltransferase RsmD n=1 Tax=Kibdelosporangium philippinense TaxID=211113 RepID=A0ABS8ZMW9_9PSEU|nr:16S rRNA (guanine(966)-N(2))-methyltransferase RsmD [Kibdelosporangium philippinense]MCE7007803.1 16S rRNA (guanine(966)-N(2))-methyltransferase RsmD [Kibdelosporangium philippinense]
MTRIVAGTAGGRRLAVPPRGTRPTSDRVREALFSAVESMLDLSSLKVLDLYAGSGALGLEALSRGASSVTFVESDRTAVNVLKANIAAVGLPGTSVVQAKVLTFLSGDASPFDLIVADPPYDMDVAAEVTALSRWAAPGALVVLEQSVRAVAPAWPAPLESLRTKKYGDTVLHWAEYPEE